MKAPIPKLLFARFHQLARASVRAGLPHFVASVVSVQGLAYLSQLVIAKLVGPADFGVVRTVEATLSVVLVVASAGMPSLVVKVIPEYESPASRGRILGALLTISFGMSLVTAAVVSLSCGTFDPQHSHYLRSLVWVVGLTACSRTCLNYFQGIKRVRLVSVYSTVLSFLSISIIVATVWWRGLEGWVLGRYCGEGCFLIFAFLGVRKVVRFTGPLPAPYRAAGLLGLGMTVAVSRLVRTAQDNAGLLALSWSHAEATQVGYYGFSALVTLVVLIVPGAIGNLALPRLVERLPDPMEVRSFYFRLTRWAILASLPLASLCFFAAPHLVRWFLPAYQNAIPLIRVLLVAVPFRVLTSMAGTLLLAYNRVLVTVLNNALALTLAMGLYLWLTPRFGAVGVAWGTLLTEAAGALLYGGTAITHLKTICAGAGAGPGSSGAT